MNPNKALWEKGDFTRIAESMRDERRGARRRARGHRRACKVLDLGCGDGTTAVPEAQLGADVLGVDIAGNLVAAGQRARPASWGWTTSCSRRATRPTSTSSRTSGSTSSSAIFGAMFAPRPFDVAKEMVRVTKPGGRIVMGNWIPGDPTLVAQILRISAAYSPPPPEGFVSPMTWGVEADVIERFTAAGVPEGNIACERDTYMFSFAEQPSELVAAFRSYYGPTMNAFEAAAANGREEELHAELDALFNEQNTSADATSIPATFLRVTVTRS